MDILKKENGSTIIEALVTIVLIGILVILTAGFVNMLLTNSTLVKQEALSLAYQEMDRTLSQVTLNDTIYRNEKGNMSVRRIITEDENGLKAEVMVNRISADTLIFSIKANYNR